MKTSTKFLLCFVCAFSFIAKTHAEQSERPLTFRLTGFLQDHDASGNDRAVPFRYITKDVLKEIGFFTGIDLNNGTLLLIDSITDTNLPSKIVARKGDQEVDVTDLFTIDQGAEVHSSRFVANVFKNATLYSIDTFKFQTLDTDTNGLNLQMQLFAKETQRALLQRIGSSRFDVVSSTLDFDGNGEISDQFGLIGPLKGVVRIGVPRFATTPVVVGDQNLPLLPSN